MSVRRFRRGGGVERSEPWSVLAFDTTGLVREPDSWVDPGTGDDFRIGEFTGHEADGYDHNYVLNGQIGTRRLIAELWEPESGRVLRCFTDQPGVQLYTGNFLWGQTCKAGQKYAKHSAVCLETQHYPDSPNQPEFPSTILHPGETYRQVCVYEIGGE